MLEKTGAFVVGAFVVVVVIFCVDENGEDVVSLFILFSRPSSVTVNSLEVKSFVDVDSASGFLFSKIWKLLVII